MRKNVALALCLSALFAGVLFSSLRILDLTNRVNRLEQARPAELPDRPVLSGKSRPASPPDGSLHKVLRVIDGDTVVIATETGSIRLRVIGIDTPETVHPSRPVEPFGPQATARAKSLLSGKTVRIQYDPDPKHDRWDKYGRLLAYLDLPDGRDYGLVMVSEGLAKCYRKFSFCRVSRYVAAEEKATIEKLGLWQRTMDPPPRMRRAGQPTGISEDH